MHTYSQQKQLALSSTVTTTATVDAAIDLAASDTYFPAWYNGCKHNASAPSTCVGTANDSVMRSVATNVIHLDGIPESACTCKKFIEVTLPLVSVGKLCIHGMTVILPNPWWLSHPELF